MNYISIKEIAKKWGLTQRRVQVLCSQDRIPGLIRIGSTWEIPEDAEKPQDLRIKNGRYIKDKTQQSK